MPCSTAPSLRDRLRIETRTKVQQTGHNTLTPDPAGWRRRHCGCRPGRIATRSSRFLQSPRDIQLLESWDLPVVDIELEATCEGIRRLDVKPILKRFATSDTAAWLMIMRYASGTNFFLTFRIAPHKWILIPPAASTAGCGASFGRPLLFLGTAMRTIVYVDGFNLYFGCLKGTPWKWFDLVVLSKNVLQQKHMVAAAK